MPGVEFHAVQTGVAHSRGAIGESLRHRFDLAGCHLPAHALGSHLGRRRRRPGGLAQDFSAALAAGMGQGGQASHLRGGLFQSAEQCPQGGQHRIGMREGNMLIGLIQGMHRGALQHHQPGAPFGPGQIIGAMGIAKPVAFAQVGHMGAEDDPVGNGQGADPQRGQQRRRARGGGRRAAQSLKCPRKGGEPARNPIRLDFRDGKRWAPRRAPCPVRRRTRSDCRARNIFPETGRKFQAEFRDSRSA